MDKIRGILIENPGLRVDSRTVKITTAHKKNEYIFFANIHPDFPLPNIIGMTWLDAYILVSSRNAAFTKLNNLISPKENHYFDFKYGESDRHGLAIKTPHGVVRHIGDITA